MGPDANNNSMSSGGSNVPTICAPAVLDKQRINKGLHLYPADLLLQRVRALPGCHGSASRCIAHLADLFALDKASVANSV